MATRAVTPERERRVCVIGNFSGRNAGDMAILGCLMKDVATQYPNVRFVVPTINPGFVRKSFPMYSVEPVSLLPTALSLKIFGLPIFRAVLSSDLVLVTDNILFDKQLFNPLFNYLSTLALVLPLARKRGISVVLYNMSLGPILTPLGRWMLEQITKNAAYLILRDTQSRDLLERLQIAHGPVEIRADCAVNTSPCPPDRLQAIIDNEGLFRNPCGTIGFNVNAYLDAYLRADGKNADLQHFTSVIAQTVDRVIAQTGTDVLFVVTQVMDTKITNEVIGKIRQRDRVQLISNRQYSYEELATVMGRLEVLVAMRTHALILASAMLTPVVAINSYPKTAGYLASIDQEHWMIRFEDLDVERLVALTLEAYGQRAQIRETLRPTIQHVKHLASQSAELLKPFLSRTTYAVEPQTTV